LLVVATAIAFFALAGMFVAACNRIVGPGPEDRGRWAPRTSWGSSSRSGCSYTSCSRSLPPRAC